MTLICQDDLPVVLLVDLRRHFGHKSCRGVVRNLSTRTAPAEFTLESQEMDTSSFDKQAKQHLKIYENVMFAAKICTFAIIVTLVIMAATLV